MTINERIRNRRMELGMTQTALAEMLGYKSRTTIAKIEDGKIELSKSRIEAIAKALNVKVSYLMGTMYEVSMPDNIFEPTFHKVPILGTIACGTPILAEQNLEGEVNVPDMQCDFALRCKGDSMVPKFLEGDIVLIRRQPDVDDGQIAAVLIGDEATLKHVYHRPDGLTLSAENMAYAPMFVSEDPAEPVRILGLAVGFLRAV